MSKTSTKEKVLRILEEKSGKAFSGSNISSKLGISRTAVWKAIKTLEKEGYRIEAVSGKGYTLLKENDVVSASGILRYLKDLDIDDESVFVFDVTTSTNDVIKEKAIEGLGEGVIAVSLEQTKGKGRKGRGFFSPKGSGIYFSILLKPYESGKDVSMITTTAAVAVARALEKEGVEDVSIKWVNDVYVRERKVCGILSEATTDLESGTIDSVVLGIGLNLYEPSNGWPDDIKDKAGSIFRDTALEDGRNRMVSSVYREFFDLYGSETSYLVSEYKKRSLVSGKDIIVISGDEHKRAKALDIDEKCGLKVRYEDGSVETLISGEISISL
jgi:BirA family biotin operon repressor/biotin-[acetyl-CoA-carboxylase] ligase